MQGYTQLRKGRRSLSNQIYHITSATRDRRDILRFYACGRAVVRSLRREQDSGHTEMLAYVVMPDHFHWLFALKHEKSLSTCVNNVKSISAREINRFLGRRGKVWQRGFHDRAIRRTEDLERIARYIVSNPLRAGIVDTLRDYPFWDAKWL